MSKQLGTPKAQRIFGPLQMAAMSEIERLRLRAGMSCEALSERAGIAERAYSKYLRPYTPGGAGRVPDDAIIEALAGAVGETVSSLLLRAFRHWGSLAGLTREMYERRLVGLAVRHRRTRPMGSPYSYVWPRMRELSALGVAARRVKLTPEDRRRIAAAGGRGRAAALPPARRSAVASQAACARWARARQGSAIQHAVGKHADHGNSAA